MNPPSQSQPSRHHFVPQFLLAEWIGADHQLEWYRHLRGEIVHERIGTRGVGFERHLYSLKGSKDFDTSLETQFMGPYLDDPASSAHKVILQRGVNEMDAAQKGYWAQFIVSLMLRVPRTVEKLHGMARETLGSLLDEDPNAARDIASNLTLREYVDKHHPWMYQQVALGAMHMGIQSKRMLKTMTTGQWALRRLSHRCHFDLLLGDEPLLVAGHEQASFLIALPLSPRVAFFVFNNPWTGHKLANMTDAETAKMLNLHTVSTAARYVFATNERHGAFIHKHLRGPASLGY